MTLLNFEGFETLGTTTGTGDAANTQERLRKRHVLRGDHGVNGPYLETGADGIGYSLAIDHYLNSFDLNLPSDQAGKTLVVGMRFRSPSSGVLGVLFQVLNWDVVGTTETAQIEIGYTSAGEIYIARGITGIDKSLESVSFVNQWYHLEAKIYFHDSNGTYEVKLNGTSILSGGPVDTIHSGTKLEFVRFINYGERIDDLYVLNTEGSINNDFLGINTRVRGILPDADGANTDWTPSAGSDHYAVVDELPETQADYVESGTINDVDTFTFPSQSITGVYGVKAEAHMMTGSVGVRDVRLKCISGVTTDNAATEGVSHDGGTEQFIENIWEEDPDASAAWTPTTFNNAEFGVEVIS
jgi:hypothetical protein